MVLNTHQLILIFFFSEELCQELEECQTSERTTQEELTMKTSQLSESEEKIAALTENITNLSNKIRFYVQQETEMNVSMQHEHINYQETSVNWLMFLMNLDCQKTFYL